MGQLTLLGEEELDKMSRFHVSPSHVVHLPCKSLTGTYLFYEGRQTPQNMLFSSHASSAILHHHTVAKSDVAPFHRPECQVRVLVLLISRLELSTEQQRQPVEPSPTQHQK